MKYVKITREELINKLIDDDIQIILSGGCNDYLFNILSGGFCGYRKYKNSELIREYYDRIDQDLSKLNIKIVGRKSESKRNTKRIRAI